MRNTTCGRSFALAAAAIACAAGPVWAQLFGPGDPVIAVDHDKIILSWYPDNEGPFNVVDQFSDTKYLNFGRAGTGVIITPDYGSAVVRSMQLTTANDAEERDPATYDLYGTNDPIVSGDNSLGDGEDWTLISSGALNLPSARETPGPFIDFANATAYTSYKIIFPTLKNDATANSMQVADIRLYTAPGGGGDQILNTFDECLAVTDRFDSESWHPANEGPGNVVDGTLAKYLNFGKENSGFIVSRADGQPVVVEEFAITTANDFEERDPASWELYGTNDPITSPNNSAGEEESWVLVDSGALALPSDRNTVGPTVTVSNATEYTGYKLVFPALKDGLNANSMQIAEVAFEGSGGCVADFNGDGSVDTRDVIAFLNAWNAGDDSADIDGNGIVDTRDVLAFLNLWNAGC